MEKSVFWLNLCVESHKGKIMENSVRNSVFGFLLLLLVGCGATNKTVAPSFKSKALDGMVTEKEFKIDVEWARPLLTNSLSQVMIAGLQPPGNTVGQINVMGNGSFLKMEGEKVSANLPYFGERQMGGGFNSNAGIKFDGIPSGLEIDKDEAKQRYDIKFTISEDIETYLVKLYLASNGAATIVVNSSQRTTIRFQGRVSALEDTDIQ